jgi:carbonic anhydrase
MKTKPTTFLSLNFFCQLSVLSLSLCVPAAWGAGAVAGHVAATDHAAPADTKTSAKKPVDTASAAESAELVGDIKKALKDKLIDKKKLTLVVSEKPVPSIKTAPRETPVSASNSHAMPTPSHAPAVAARTATAAHAPVAVVNPRVSRDYIKAKAAALTGHENGVSVTGDGHGEAHWSYSGATGPQAWGQMKPEFNVCAIGKRQSPINIEESATLQGPAEALQFNYTASSGVVVNNGHTIQVDLYGDNTLTVRGSVYKLLQFHFHTPSEEQINYRNAAMVAHLVHKNAQDQLAVVAVLLDPGLANALISKVWTYMPLDANDQVRMPTGIVDMNELLPKDQRYYQFIGSLTTPPCTEGVLWMVLKQPTQLSREQIRLFQQLYPNNARPVQAVNGRPVRDAQ